MGLRKPGCLLNCALMLLTFLACLASVASATGFVKRWDVQPNGDMIFEISFTGSNGFPAGYTYTLPSQEMDDGDPRDISFDDGGRNLEFTMMGYDYHTWRNRTMKSMKLRLDEPSSGPNLRIRATISGVGAEEVGGGYLHVSENSTLFSKNVQPSYGYGPAQEEVYLPRCVTVGEISGCNPAVVDVYDDRPVAIYNVADVSCSIHIQFSPSIGKIPANLTCNQTKEDIEDKIVLSKAEYDPLCGGACLAVALILILAGVLLTNFLYGSGRRGAEQANPCPRCGMPLKPWESICPVCSRKQREKGTGG